MEFFSYALFSLCILHARRSPNVGKRNPSPALYVAIVLHFTRIFFPLKFTGGSVGARA